VLSYGHLYATATIASQQPTMSLQGYNEYMERSHSDNAITVGRCVGIGESTNTLPVQRIAEHARSNLGEWCLVIGPENTYISRAYEKSIGRDSDPRKSQQHIQKTDPSSR
jgi:hypothetical protein